MRKLTTLTLAAAFALSMGCAMSQTPALWTPTGGSRADATVEIGCIYDPTFEYPLQTQDRQQLARERCQAWGYADAQPFGEPMERCLARQVGAFGQIICLEKQATQAFQCIGRGDSEVLTKTGNK